MSVYLRQVKTETGWVEGIPAADPRITSYKGIPYAKPPIGELRWKAPQPADAWEGILPCKEFGPIAMQRTPGLADNVYTKEWHVDPEIVMSEDCLYLNVWTPAKTGDEKLPVFVWFFGGGLQEGYPPEMEFDGERIARRGIVVVTVNYRLNSFGFLAHPDITAENPDAPANFGFLDQQYSLKWVQRNIAAFGGDPSNVSIGGQSAGGMSVSAQLYCKANEGLFHKAIIMSGIVGTGFGISGTFTKTLAEAEEVGKAFFDFLGVKTLEEARALDAFYVRDKTAEFRGGMFATVWDDKFQFGDNKLGLRHGDRLDVPMIVGWTNGESVDGPKGNTKEEILAEIEKYFNPEYAQIIAAEVEKLDDVDAIKKLLNRMGPELGSRSFLRGDEKSGKNTSKRWAYEFGPEMPGDDEGAFHSSDLWFFFESLAKCWRPFTGKHFDLARQMCNYWCNFFKNGDPNGLDADETPMPAWAAYTEEKPATIHFYDQIEVDEGPHTKVLEAELDNILANS